METKTAPQAETTTQCQRLGHCKEHKPCCYCAEEARVKAEFLALMKAA